MCGCKMPLSSSNLNILDLCRLCLGKDNNLIPVLNNNVIGNQLCDKISVCLTVEIKNEDEVSQKICNHCLTKVDSFFEFRNSTLECQKVLQRWASGEKQKTIESENAALNSKDISKGIKEKDNTELNKTNECDKSEVENNSRGHSDSRYDEENVTQELIRFYKSLASEGQTPASVISREREVPGPSGIQECNKKSPPELKARFKQHKFGDSEGQTDYKKKSETDISPSDQHSEQNHLVDLCPEVQLKAAEAINKEVVNKEYNKKNLECNLCQFTARYKSQLDIHIKRHKKDYKIFCDVCHKGFYYQHEILMHKALHEEKNRFQCDECQKTFVYRHSLVSHRRKHTESFKPLETFQCDKCSKKFNKRSYLKRHMDVHTGVNRVVCEVCGQVLCSPIALRSHSLTHTGERPFSCTVCGKSFTSKKYMVIHKRMHTGAKPFKCKVCDKSFSQQSTLIVHNRYHSGERPFQCQVCYKAFITKTILKVHQKSHTA
ncbi:unnamed protein product [Nezara viridula]|uniref:Uncharacterized protein n=1 Tax=Nezara viridula TaxID=85310 RepID=A0A9P0MT98_NEZVI|nr:unnamed protein product [Nezara viridula]